MIPSLLQDSNTFLNDLLITATYKDGGRGPCLFDCWGLTRFARSELYNTALLPSYGHISAEDKRKLTRACAEVIKECVFEQSDAHAGSIATVWKQGACIHIALVIEKEGRLAVLEINEKTGIRTPYIEEFERLHSDIRYFND